MCDPTVPAVLCILSFISMGQKTVDAKCKPTYPAVLSFISLGGGNSRYDF